MKNMLMAEELAAIDSQRQGGEFCIHKQVMKEYTDLNQK